MAVIPLQGDSLPHIVDATLFYTPTSGGVRRYLLTKHAWLGRRGRVRHTLFVPGPEDAGQSGGIVEFRSPHLRAGYRCPVRLPALRRTLSALEPDLLEAADPYHMAWQVVEVARRRGIPAVAFCHSDIVNLAEMRFGSLAGRATGAYLRTLYGHFDRILAPSQVVADHLKSAGIGDVVLQPLGVDTDVFLPDRSDPRLRERLGLTAATRLLCFAGRLAPEKNLPDLMKMAAILGEPYHLLIVGGERAERIGRHVSVLPYEPDERSIASLMAA